MRCHLRGGIYRTGDFPLLHQSSAVPADLRIFPSVSGRKFPYGEIFCRKNASKARVTDGKVDSEGENCDRRSACATRGNCPGPLFMPYPGMKPLSSPAVVKALLLPLHCMYGLFAHIHVSRYCLPFPWEKRLVATGGVTQTFPDMEEYSGKYIVHLYIEPIITE